MGAFRITSRFGEISSIRDGKAHTGIDIAMPEGTTLRSVAEGFVSQVFSGKGTIGKGVRILGHDGREYEYGHMSTTHLKVGDKVNYGELIGKSGNTGNSTGPHLHFGVKENGQYVNPEPYSDKLIGITGDIDVASITPPTENVATSNELNVPRFDMSRAESNTVVDDPNWLSAITSNGADIFLKPVADGIGSFFLNLATGIMHQIPMIATVGGLICFILTMATAKSKTYFWGLGLWGFSAIMRGINVEMGI